VRIGDQVYQFWKSREIEGTIKTVTVKRTPLGELFLAVVVAVGASTVGLGNVRQSLTAIPA